MLTIYITLISVSAMTIGIGLGLHHHCYPGIITIRCNDIKHDFHLSDDLDPSTPRQGSHWLIESPINIIYTNEIIVCFVLYHINTTSLYTISR